MVVVNLLPTALVLLGLFILWRFLAAVQVGVMLLLLSLVLSAALYPLVRFMHERAKLPRALAVLLTIGGSLVLVAGFIGLLVPTLVNDLRETWATASRDGRFSSDLQRLTQGNPFLQRLLTSDTPAEIGATLRNAPKPFMNTIMQVSGNVFALLGYSFIVLLLMLYTLSRPEPLLQGLIGAVPNGHRGRATRATEDIVAALRVWGLSTLAVMASGGVLVWIGLVALGVDNALVFAFLSALGELIPNVGPLVANSIPVLITFAAEPQRAVWVALWLVGVQIVQGVFSPYLFGKTIELHPVSIIAGIVLLGTAFGLVGAFLTVPILIIVKVLYETYYLSRPDHDEVPEEKVAGILEEA